jgi:hypothetical protein
MLTKEAEKKPMRTNLRSVSKIFWCPKGLLKGNLQKASVLQGNRKKNIVSLLQICRERNAQNKYIEANSGNPTCSWKITTY